MAVSGEPGPIGQLVDGVLANSKESAKSVVNLSFHTASNAVDGGARMLLAFLHNSRYYRTSRERIATEVSPDLAKGRRLVRTRSMTMDGSRSRGVGICTLDGCNSI